MMRHYDYAVVGAGVLGLAHAYALAKRGRRVVVFERDPGALGASIRNFGMLWPIGQPAGFPRSLALRSLEIWLEVLRDSGAWFDRSGSLHVAYHEDEAQVLREFEAEANATGFACEWLKAEAASSIAPRLRRTGLIGALSSRNEVCVDPREVIANLPGFLSERYGVDLEFGKCVTHCEPPVLIAGGERLGADRAIVCSGADMRTLFPDSLAKLELVPCKLQMMRAQPGSTERIGPMLAAGLTLAHYRGFAGCPTLPELSRRLERDWPEHTQHGVHVLVSQHRNGALTLGDSHEYGEPISPFDNPAIDELVLEYLATFLDPPPSREQIVARWHGVYVKHRTDLFTLGSPRENTLIVTGVGGAGMTLSFGLAEHVVNGIETESEGGE